MSNKIRQASRAIMDWQDEIYQGSHENRKEIYEGLGEVLFDLVDPLCFECRSDGIDNDSLGRSVEMLLPSLNDSERARLNEIIGEL